MIRKIWMWSIWIIWLLGMLVTKDNFGWLGVGLYALSSVLYSGFVLLMKEGEDEDD